MERLNNALRGLTANLSTGLLTATGAETVHDTTQTMNYAINGVLYRKTAITDGATPTTDYKTAVAFVALAADKACVFVWGLNSSGAVKVVQGDVVSVDGDTDRPLVRPAIPDIPDDICPIAYQVVQTNGASSSWTFGTSNWNATGVTDAIVDVSTLPRRLPGDVTA